MPAVVCASEKEGRGTRTQSKKWKLDIKFENNKQCLFVPKMTGLFQNGRNKVLFFI